MILRFFLLILLTGFASSHLYAKGEHLFDKENLVAWCIVPFDSEKRNSEERAAMLKELGLSRFAWDWRAEHVPQLPHEIEVMRAHGISMDAVWIWLDGDDFSSSFGNANDTIIQTVGKTGLQTDYWVSFPGRYLDSLPEDERLAFAVESIGRLANVAAEQGCRVSLYNHGSWFGDPRNQVRIIEALQMDNVGIVYNFHHAHPQLDEFPLLLEIMLPHLYTVNLNGMHADGPKILTIGQGESEQWMLQLLKESGFEGTIGILSHRDDADARVILQANLEGLADITQVLK